ncbi:MULTISPECIES: hypothetical protein [unclassified Rhizobacter]|uniref:hypothetical protein n=1 Tax=unclassified Rhizobacter TaxID=2640088 RepID=UPI0006F6DC93|nr:MULTISPECIES: hypothetical protein [unclassified Rhizobacter]KQU67172.1 hypothetical protein ASC88_09175 [Rhizobacter sp. Root29]KQV98117.1 hypothetical protein ASC98_08890 [Rhizobacter sp. Root1238]KRB02015.1 hypothetical protein ASE08_16450 [Rhizobacter sp. Root16D2]
MPKPTDRSAPPSYTPASTPTAREGRRPGTPPKDDDNVLESIGKAVSQPVSGAAEPDERQQTGNVRKPR